MPSILTMGPGSNPAAPSAAPASRRCSAACAGTRPESGSITSIFGRVENRIAEPTNTGPATYGIAATARTTSAIDCQSMVAPTHVIGIP